MVGSGKACARYLQLLLASWTARSTKSSDSHMMGPCARSWSNNLQSEVQFCLHMLWVQTRAP